MSHPYRIFVDLDGVLADFDEGVRMACGRPPEALPDRVMWPILAKTADFYAKLPWTADGRELWDFVKPFHPIILTGLPIGKWAEPQKRSWCARELGSEVPVIACLSRAKGKAAAERLAEGEIPVLVDDRLKIKEAWDAIGGIFILHTSTAESIRQLKALGHPFHP